MPRIENEPKLDFRDVLLRPKPTNIRSRADVNLNREYIFKHSKKTYNGIPIIVSNMDTVETFEMAKILANHGLFTTIHKHYTIDEWTNFVSEIGKDPKVIEMNGKKFKLFYGMSSDTAMKKHFGSVAEYRASEGKTITIPYRGDVNVAIKEILGGVRSACTYLGAKNLKELPERTTFVRVNQQMNEMYTQFEI